MNGFNVFVTNEIKNKFNIELINVFEQAKLNITCKNLVFPYLNKYISF